MTPQQFVAKWRAAAVNERSAAQSHFNDLCELVEHKKPLEADPTGEHFVFEAGVKKASGGQGFADVWYRDHFALEYKGPDGNLDRAYTQLLQYREALENPPLLIVSDLQTIIIHTNFTNSVKATTVLTLNDLLTPQGLLTLRNVFFNPAALRPEKTAAQVTEEAATRFAHLAEHLRKWGNAPLPIAHYLIRLLFCLFAEDIDLLPRELFTRLVERGRRDPQRFNHQIKQLFHAMTEGDDFGEFPIRYFDGGLFDGDTVLDLDADGLTILHGITALDWSAIEPAIFGTLFTRSLDPSKRAQLGAHYTSREDILLIVEPVLMAPLRREWAKIQEEARKLAQKRDAAPTRSVISRVQNELRDLVMDFMDKLRDLRVLDPACGSGNFLYICLRLLLDLEKEVSNFCGEVGLQPFFPEVNPVQLFGIEKDEYAHELAQATVWIGYLQWLHENGYGFPSEPILKPLDNIKLMDAILAFDAQGKPVEPEWPAADVIVGNPPFLGGNKIRQELGDVYVNALFLLYDSRVPAFSDLVCYWFEQSRKQVEHDRADRVGLLATNSIRGGVNRVVLDRVKNTGDIFFAWSDRPWVLEGASVRVSMVGFSKKYDLPATLDGEQVEQINADLTSISNLQSAQRLPENRNICFYGSQQKGSFDISPELAQQFLSMSNASGVANAEVVKKSVNGIQIARDTKETWVIDFGNDTPLDVASQYEAPFEYVRRVVYRERVARKEQRQRVFWWLHARPSPRYRDILKTQARYIASPTLAKHRLYVWLSPEVLADHQLIVFARDDDYFFGVLHSRPHELWALRLGTSFGETPRYTPSTTVETFPFPWPPGKEPQADPRVEAIAAAARDLVQQRDAWLNPPGLGEKDLQKRTLTNLYNERPSWLDAAHKTLDAAVFDAYGWPHGLSDEEILARLLALNLERTKGQSLAQPSAHEA